jgi:predicted N-acyltransferase
MNMLEDLLRRGRNQYRNIWYAADGVYSMYGDTVPVQDLLALRQKYPQLHLYIDDVHGMSWAGKHGTGYVMSQLGELPEQTIVVGTLSKSFGASGSVVAFGDEALYEAYRIFGGPQTFSAQLEPSSVAAALASARIHLSDEIYSLQADLAEKVSYCNELIRQTDLPLIQENVCPVHFIGAAQPGLAYNFARRLMNEGFYINVATFPVVPVRNAGIRFTISRHNQKAEIKALVDAMQYHYPLSLEEEGMDLNRVRKAFKLPEVEVKQMQQKSMLKLSAKLYHSIADINQEEWNTFFADKGCFDHQSLSLLEAAFTANERKDQNWDFIYLIIRDQSAKVVLATFFTAGLWKDDMLAKSQVSTQVELIRAQQDAYYMMSQVLSMGSLITDGDHLYLDKSHALSTEALKLLCIHMEELKIRYDAKMIMVRDLSAEDQELSDFFHQQGFMKIDLPEGSELDLTGFRDEDEFIAQLSSNSRRHLRKDVLQYRDQFDIVIKQQLDEVELQKAYQLYLNVQQANHALNNITYPFRLMQEMNDRENWEFILLYAKQEGEPLIGMVCGHKGYSTYQGVILGMDYSFRKLKTYKQILYQVVMRSKQIGCKAVHLGLTANTEKRKLGARLIPRVGFLQTESNFHLEVLENLQGNTALAEPKAGELL